MVKVRDDYITPITKDGLKELGENDEIYIITDDGDTYHISQMATIQADDNSICFTEWGVLKLFTYDHVEMYRVKNEKIYFSYDSDDVIGFIWVFLFGIMILTIFFIVIGAI